MAPGLCYAAVATVKANVVFMRDVLGLGVEDLEPLGDRVVCSRCLDRNLALEFRCNVPEPHLAAAAKLALPGPQRPPLALPRNARLENCRDRVTLDFPRRRSLPR